MSAIQTGPGYTVEDFNFWLPISKAEVKKVKDAKGNVVRKIQGVASTPDMDLQGERIHQHGIDFNYFLKHGYFNNDHKPGPENKVGEPTHASLRNGNFWVEGFLYNDHPISDHYWNLMRVQERTPQARRKVGFSVQGKIKRRMGKEIMHCWVQDVAITTAPINTKTWAQIAKSLAADEWVDEDEMDRALTAGYAISNQTGGAALRTESLIPKVKKTTYDKRDLTKSEAIELIQLRKGYSRATARLIVELHCSGVI